MPDGSAFNVADALGRLMNKKKFYQKLLDKFAAENADYDAKIQAAIDAKNTDEGVHLAHTMKGLAGNLGATDLQEASRVLEMKFREGDADADCSELMDAFRTQLKRALDEIAAGVDMG